MQSKLKSVGLFFILLLSLASCRKDFKEINTNPNSFSTASDGSLFNEVISSLQLGWNEQFYINNEILYKQTQLAALTKEGWGNFTLGTEEIWSNYYGALPEVRELEKRFGKYDNSPGVVNMRAMLKITMALKTFKVTDIFGDMPFTEAGYGFQNLDYLRPKFDKQRDIYLALLDDLKWADENIDETAPIIEPFASFSGFDKLFNGDLKKWKKLANSLRLRHAMRMAEKEPVIAGEIIRDIIENNKPVFVGYNMAGPVLESACLWPAAVGFKNESLSWSFREHKNLRMGSNIWHLLSDNDSTNGSGIFDPRAYIFFETNNNNQWVPYPQIPDASTPSEGGIPYDGHRDQTGAFNIKGETCRYSPFNYFIVSDVYYMPIIFFTGAEIHFLKAEAYFRGIGVAMDKDLADNEYMNGVNSSVEWWLKVADNSKLPLSGMTFPEMIPIPQGLNASSVLMRYGSWNAASEEEKLEFIYTQWSLDAFRQPWEIYALARRTGKTPREGAPISHYRLPYPPSEVEYNSANCATAISNQGGDKPENKIWWIPN
ncbi:MAG: SusD/RagB family nutrient-binding outer membrane lipoprotein [Bacteroidota bacterium]